MDQPTEESCLKHDLTERNLHIRKGRILERREMI